MKRTSIEGWVLRELWEAYPEGAAKNQLASREMAEYIRRWEWEDAVLRHQADLDKPERTMCPECGLKYFHHEIPDWCIGHCPLKERADIHPGYYTEAEREEPGE